ncbi:2-oxoisovalerate dehydrogenase subunit beta [Aspergillus saccharolyticus JOP 1030-1]|uniref:3-methyl-2-oxobutanoate dehydrogenase (2-methylpropanoyl-transferring) n=1 Tax=Aspergillus saccharolyticus JOP 1030-1 TaxID=1450539 RepID=A0A318ZCW7_9EURO|nr:2-oxoisovalerate dehydrogenase subunit beta [Aspergillus saccharolyticus JOP 1030-1]PYH42483.1 2-oxoisovalerate dehydrogenase subunit beta [Aspergillus saccharolyticus JOP 1030-1]
MASRRISSRLFHPQIHGRTYSTAAASPSSRLNLPIDYKSTPLLHHTASTLPDKLDLPASTSSKSMNLYQAINSALRTALAKSNQVMLFGEDVAFGGVFRCSMDLQTEFGSERVFNTPLTEQGIVGFAIGAAAQGMKPVAEIQFADYVFPAFDQIVNEAAKFRYREGATNVDIGGLVIRMPCGAVGHGALYHSQSPEALFAHIPGIQVVMPRSPSQAKGLLLSAIFEHNNPVLFMEPKVLYRAAVEQVPNEYYTIPLSEAEVVKPGNDLTVVSYGQPMYLCAAAIESAERALGASIELIDLRTIYPWDRQTVLDSVKKTGRAVVVHESMVNYSVGSEVAATIQERAFLRLEAPVKRVGGWSTHTGLIYEKFIIPDVTRIYDAIKQTLDY